MRHPDLDYMILMERRREELAEAAHSRLVKEALDGKRIQNVPKGPSIIDRLGEAAMVGLAYILSYAGKRMIAWSCKLQYRRALLAQRAARGQAAPCA